MKEKYKPIVDFDIRALNKPTVLIVEPNSYHGEILPGFTHLFQEIGYDVTILMRGESSQEDPFTLYPKATMPTIFTGSASEIKATLLKETINKFDLILFSTNVWWEKGIYEGGYLNYLGFIPQPKYGNLFIEHNLMFLDADGARGLLNEGKVFTLLEYNYEKVVTKMVNPHYFGSIKIKRVLNKNIKILVLGSSTFHTINLNKLFSTISNLKKQKIIKSTDKFLIVGKKPKIPDDIKSNIEILGRLNFNDYYRTIESCDYLLTVIDNSGNDLYQKKYSEGTTSGTVQISLGFSKPMIIEKVYADVYNFDNKTAITYDSDKLFYGIKFALEMKPAQYKKTVDDITRKANNMDEKSKRTLIESIGRLKKEHHKKNTINLLRKVSKKIFYKNKNTHKSKDREVIVNSEYFDRDYYLKNNPDVVRSGIDPVDHYLFHGGFEGRAASEKFYTQLYLDENPFLINGGQNPLLHFLSNANEKTLYKYTKSAHEARRQKFVNDEMAPNLRRAKRAIVMKSMAWSGSLLQRPHHLARLLADKYTVILYVDQSLKKPTKVNDSLYIMPDEKLCIDLLENYEVKKYYWIFSTTAIHRKRIKSIYSRGFSIVYDYIDDIHESISGNIDMQRDNYENLKSINPSILIASATNLYIQLSQHMPKNNVLLEKNAVDMSHFNLNKKLKIDDAPNDIKNILLKNRPIVGYYGAIAPWLDYHLINRITERRKDLEFVFIGNDYQDSLKNLVIRENVHFLGQKEYMALSKYSYWFNCAIIPFEKGDIAKSTSPVKLFEYMAMGIPTVCTSDLAECEGYDFVYMSSDDADFERNIDKAIHAKTTEKAKRVLLSYAKKNTWQSRVKDVQNEISKLEAAE